MLAANSFAQDNFPFQGESSESGINVRADSTVSSITIYSLKKGERIEIISERYGWYKIGLPKSSYAYIKKTLAECIKYPDSDTVVTSQQSKECQKIRIIKENVNIRLLPNESSPILGKADKEEVINARGENNGWYRIEPTQNTFGWVHKKFIKKVLTAASQDAKLAQTLKKATLLADTEKEINSAMITMEGMVEPYGKFFRRVYTHKLIDKESKIFLLKAKKNTLDKLNHLKARVTGKIINDPKQKYPIIEILSIEEIR